MFKVTDRKKNLFGKNAYHTDFICDTEADVATLPTSTTKGTGGVTAADNATCSAGSSAYIIAADANSKLYMLNTQDQWIGQ